MKEEKELDELLDDFILDESDELDWDSYMDEEQPVPQVMPELEPCIFQGKTYHVPHKKDPDYRFQRLVVMTKSEQLYSTEEKASLIMESNGWGREWLNVELEGVCPLGERTYITVLLYRVGNAEPLKVCIRSVVNSKSSIIFEFTEIDWIAGEYFLLVHNASCNEEEMEPNWDTVNALSCYSFRMLPHGRTLKHPSITQFSLSKDKMLKISLEGKTSRMDEYRLLMYDEDWMEVTRSRLMCPYRNVLKGFFWSSSWSDGDYKLVMTHNEEPYSLISIKWMGKKMKECSWIPLTVDSPYYMLAKYMNKDSDWQDLCKIHGCRSIRKSLVGHYRYKVLNGWRENLNLYNIMNPVHSSVALVDGVYDAELAGSLVRILNPGMDLRVKNCEVLLEVKNTVDPYEDMREALENCFHKVLCLHHLSALNTASTAQMFLRMLEETLRNTPKMALMLMGTRSEIEQVLEDSPLISRLILPENRFHTEMYSVREQIDCLRKYWMDMEMKLDSEAAEKLEDLVVSNREIMGSWRKEELRDWCHKEIYPRYMNRVFKAGGEDASWKVLSYLMPEDICLPSNVGSKDGFSESIRELNEMVGLKELKQGMVTLFNRTRFDKMRREMGLPVLEKGGYHMIFTGNPGTGKTTVAKLIGRVFHSLGLLSKGGVIVTERTKLVGRYLGETEKNMVAILEQARGNVLFIDEAYSLCDNDRGDRKDFGCRVLESLLTVLAQKNPDMIVILAGYGKEMNRMLEMNPGMKGRFPYKFNFDDYSADELFQIADALLAKAEYVLTPDAEQRLKETIVETVCHKDAFFHNARWVEQYIWDGVVSAMSDRLMSSPLCAQSRELLQTIEVQDIDIAYQRMKPNPVSVTALRKRIGFVA